MNDHLRKFPWRRLIQAGIVAIALGYLIKSILIGFREAETLVFTVAPFPWKEIFFSLLLLVGHLCFQGFIWVFILWRLEPLQKAPPLCNGIIAFLLAQPGKYLPGKIWVIAGRVYLGERLGVPREVTLVGSVLGDFFSILAASLITMLSFWLNLPIHLPSYFPLLAAFGTLFLLDPRLLKILTKGINRLLALAKKAKKEPLKIDLTTVDSLLILLFSILSWGIFGAAFTVFATSVAPLAGLGNLVWLSISHIAALVVGYLALASPGGLGVREGLLTYFLGFCYPPGMAVTIALLARLWMTAGEIIALVLALGVRACILHFSAKRKLPSLGENQ